MSIKPPTLPSKTLSNSYVKSIAPWLIYASYVTWWFQPYDLFRMLPTYGDALEVLWQADWLVAALKAGDLGRYATHPLTYYPEGWQVGTFADGIGTAIPMLLFRPAGGNVFAFNAAMILSSFVAFSGMFKLTRRYASMLAATVAALAFTMWDFRFLGHLQIILGSSLLPWIVLLVEWALDRGKRGWPFLIAAGMVWAGAIATSLYFTWLGFLLLAGWFIGRLISHREEWPELLRATAITGVTTLLLAAPFILFFIRASEMARTPFYDISQLADFAASLNTVSVPRLSHEQLGGLVSRMYSAKINEAAFANYGFVISLLALISVCRARWRQARGFWQATFVAVLGTALALGPYLHWSGLPVRAEEFRPINHVIWTVGHLLKPKLFPGEAPLPELVDLLPGPHIALSVLLPYWEGVRTTARFLIAGGIGLFLLSAAGLDSFHNRWLRLGIVSLVFYTIVPFSYSNLPDPYRLPLHPAYQWLANQDLAGEAIVDVWSPWPGSLSLRLGPDGLWAAHLHQKPTVVGGGSVYPGHTMFLERWLAQQGYPYADPAFRAIMATYRVRYLFLHMYGPNEGALLESAKDSPAFSKINCYGPPYPAGGVWPEEICVLTLPPTETPQIGDDLLFRHGWGGREPWGIWGTGSNSTIQWIATAEKNHLLGLNGFPFCEAGGNQLLEIKVKGILLARKQWSDCDDWSGEVVVPAELVDLGWNEVAFSYKLARSPDAASGGLNPDGRELAVGFTRLQIDR